MKTNEGFPVPQDKNEASLAVQVAQDVFTALQNEGRVYTDLFEHVLLTGSTGEIVEVQSPSGETQKARIKDILKSKRNDNKKEVLLEAVN